MVGVLAAITILSALLIPKVFEAMYNARISNALVSYQTVKAAVTQHFGTFGSLSSLNGTNLSISAGSAYTNYDGVLLLEGFLDKPFTPKLGTNATIQLVNVSNLSPNTSPNGGGNSAYDLDGDGQNDVVGNYMVEAVIYGVSQDDAKAVNDRLDGPNMGEQGNSGHDFFGRVIYRNPPGQGTSYELHIYIAHR
ncbi:MAG: hypothetical protein DME25_03080 [Verrucomicrobia bacterium]|nr:MAG: hypothetical protein DME25_03080 [Verrucomicrobiota bacterium]